MAVTYATFDPANKGSMISLSGGNLVATGMGSGGGIGGSVLSTIGVSSGKWYWEYTMTTDPNQNTTSGVANASANLGTGNAFVGNDANGWGWYDNAGGVFNNGSLTGTQSPYATGDILGVALDADAKTVQFYKNNSSTGSLITSLSTTMYAAVGVGSNSVTTVWTANFGATSLSFTPPVGFNAGLYTSTAGNSSLLMFF